MNEDSTPPQGADADLPRRFAEARQLHLSGRLQDADRIYRQILDIDPRHADSLHLMGVMAYQTGRLEVAAKLIGEAIRINGTIANYHSNLGSVLKDLGHPEQAIAAYQGAIGLNPDFADARSNLGNVLLTLGRLNEAVEAYESAIRLKPDFAMAHSNLGSALRDLGRLDDSVAAFNAAIRLNPDLAMAHANLGNLLKDLGRPDSAVDAYGNAIRLQPNLAEAHYNLGSALEELGRPLDAVAAYDAAIRARPRFPEAHSNLLMTLHYQLGITSKAIFQAARRFAEQVERKQDRKFAVAQDPERRLRIGYVSADFKRHPVGYLLSGVLAHRDRSSQEIFCYSNSPREDDLTAQLRANADQWRSITGLSDEAAAEMIAEDGVDVLVDLSGHTALNRLPMFALKPAPLQVSWLGYFGTTGLGAMDYVLADRFVAPETSAPHFTETIWRLPDSYMCFAPPDMELPDVARSSTGVEPITFGSFNNHAKTSDLALSLWSRILAKAAGSRLLLKTKALEDEKTRERVWRRFAEHGIERARIVLEGASPRAELLASYNRIDVALDPTPYGGGVTTAEALLMGAPVVTLRGETWVGRVTESILTTTGLPELVATTPEAYVEIAAALANDRPRLQGLQAGLRAKVMASAFCDGPGFAHDVEEAYRGMWRQWCARRSRPG